jgi:hypothetical protein
METSRCRYAILSIMSYISNTFKEFLICQVLEACWGPVYLPVLLRLAPAVKTNENTKASSC